MIVRDVLQRPELARTIDRFNDGNDTLRWLKACEPSDQRDEAIRLLESKSNIISEAFTDEDQTDSVSVDDSFTKRMAEFAALQLRRRDVESELEVIKQKSKALEADLLEEMSQNGIDNMKCGGLTVYKRTDLYVSKRSDVETSELVAVMKSIGLGYLVAEGYAPQSLKSVIREHEKEGKEIHEELASRLNIGHEVKLATRK